jgi:hypothetical protein
MADPATRADDFIVAGLASLGIEADEIELAVMRVAHELFWPQILALLAQDLGELAPERNLDLSGAPRS